MDVGALASATIGASVGKAQLAVAAHMLKMSAEQGANVVKIIEAAQDNMQRLANVAASIGSNVDISV